MKPLSPLSPECIAASNSNHFSASPPLELSEDETLGILGVRQPEAEIPKMAFDNDLAIDLFIKKLAGDETDNSQLPLTLNILVGGRYKMCQLIGSGAYGNVYKTIDVKNECLRAVKIIKTKHNETGKVAQIREVEVIWTLFRQNPESARKYIVHLHHVFTSHNHLLLAYELLGPSVGRVLNENRRQGFSLEQTREIGIQLVNAINFLHQLGIAHHDLKPDNIAFVNPAFDFDPVLQVNRMRNTDIRILDFGSAASSSETTATKIATTRSYRSPEMGLDAIWNRDHREAENKSCFSPSSDVWSAACTLFEIFTGNLLFNCRNEIEKYFQYESFFGPLPVTFGLASMLSCFNDQGRLKYDASTMSARRHVSQSSFREIGSVFQADQLFDLLSQMLVIDVNERITAREVLNNSFWTIAETPSGTSSTQD
ncbi:dual specificity protein kinase CLK2 [Folsomia candida]|uniref:Dual specificity protein kinase CLK2 n=1 Tax=Folsomia candida TaxID=158441 RepID=A0A226E4W9_FOLCA|nr:dual specificity protein kinase CLK2 [Folsomia candida]XP_035709914.1 dual specificity protein kinase CLK2 [Folsomia candida]OXA52350.1 Dual specificity protein kinase CLK2 [Folsomia candida]